MRYRLLALGWIPLAIALPWVRSILEAESRFAAPGLPEPSAGRSPDDALVVVWPCVGHRARPAVLRSDAQGVRRRCLSATVEAMAEENVRQLMALQPQGPYLLGGYCHGGLIAYEMARQMKQQGIEVGIVILLDAWVPRYFGWLNALIRLGGRLARIDVDAQTRLYARLRRFLVRASNVHRGGLRDLSDSLTPGGR